MIIKEIHKFSKNKLINKNLIMLLVICLFISCNFLENQMTNKKEITAEEILNNPDYLAISYGGYRHNTRDIQPTMDELKEDLVDATLDAYDAEADIVEWIFEEGDLDFLTKEQTLEFIKHRFNESLNAIGIDSVFSVDEKSLETTEWFDDEILTTKHTDFFNKRSINYSKKQKSITEDDLF